MTISIASRNYLRNVFFMSLCFLVFRVAYLHAHHRIMDTLLAEINAKRKSSSEDAGPSRKYMKRGEVEAEKEAAEAAKVAEAKARRERLRLETQAVKMRKEVSYM